ncbi:MAG TPA: molybdopterin molybdenumtransferase MoeA, partial [Rhodocyclaceae bacterium]|nr:molybdopterin molybdenumtransferase MoeA [Rhodocyclaceae bacterium]
KIAIKPGKPLAFGEITSSGKPVWFVGLPGNPVSSFVTFVTLVRPFIRRLQGVQQVLPRAFAMRADFDWQKADPRQEFLRARINADGGLELFPNQGSGVTTSLVWGDGLVVNPPDTTIARGEL